MRTPLFISELDCRKIMATPGAMSSAIEEMRRFLMAEGKDQIASQPRIHLSPPSSPGTEMSGRCIRILPAISDELGAAIRVYTMDKVGDPSRPAPCELILLFDPMTLTLRSAIEDYSLHSLRTSLPSAIATSLLADPGAQGMGLIGTGRQAAAQATAIASVRRLTEIRVFGRNRERREAFARELGNITKCNVIPCDTAQEAVREMKIVTLAANTREPVLFGDWLEPGMHVNSISACELDEKAILISSVFPSSTETLLYHQPRYTPFPEMVEAGKLKLERLETELRHVVAGLRPGRTSRDEITLFVSTGSATWDLSVGHWIDHRARSMGLGRKLFDDDAGRSVSGFITPPPSEVSSV